jgi:hypothetical protein
MPRALEDAHTSLRRCAWTLPALVYRAHARVR